MAQAEIFFYLKDNTVLSTSFQRDTTQIMTVLTVPNTDTSMSITIQETNNGHSLEDFWARNYEILKTTQINSIDITINENTIKTITDITQIRYQEILFSNINNTFTKQLFISFNNTDTTIEDDV